MKIVNFILIIIAMTIILLNIDYDPLLSWEKNGTYLISLVACILALLYTILFKSKKKSTSETLKKG